MTHILGGCCGFRFQDHGLLITHNMWDTQMVSQLISGKNLPSPVHGASDSLYASLFAVATVVCIWQQTCTRSQTEYVMCSPSNRNVHGDLSMRQAATRNQCTGVPAIHLQSCRLHPVVLMMLLLGVVAIRSLRTPQRLALS